ncbi:glycoside hydrolase family 2 TIM barrel-domain containing protein [Pedobacter sp. P351]|uniref:glycoside hydrolase family 2 TIM barrel-domain containing protein n=1 Tax=Pedobacter superstes TaxID=3133441 RepID=UPI00309DFA84
MNTIYIAKRLLTILCLNLAFLSVSAQQIGQKKLFTDGWKFYKGEALNAERSSFNDNTWRNVQLPHDWSIEGPFSKEWASGTGYLPGGIAWYRKTFNEIGVPPSGKAFIYFDGVYKNSEVWINEHYLGKRPNGFIPFQYELTPYLKRGSNTIAVKVDHSKFADSRFYTGSGIYRDVYLITEQPIYIPKWGVSFTTPEVSLQRARADVKVWVDNSLAVLSTILVETKLSLGSRTIATATKNISIGANSSGEIQLSMPVTQPKLWSVEDPHLYTLTVSTYNNGKKTDEYKEKVGIRTIKFDANEGFFLNGKNMKLKGICVHHDAGALGAAVPREVWARRLNKLKEVGCNSIRMSHYPHQDYFYELCDQMGFLVIDEAFDEWEEGKNKWIEGWNDGKPGRDGSHEEFKEWAQRDVKDMVLRNRNHPSIIMWSIGNEIDYPNDPYTHEILNTGRNPQIYGKGHLLDHPAASRLAELSKILVQAVKEEDTSRPVTAALAGVVMSNTTRYPENLDIVGYNYQEYRYEEDHKKYPNRIIYGSENGMSYDAWEAVDTSKNIFGQYLWTGYDFIGESRAWPIRSSGAGLLDLAGFPKPNFYTTKSLWVTQPLIYLTASKVSQGTEERGRRESKPSWNWNTGDKIRVIAISNTEESELFLNGKSLGKKIRIEKSKPVFWDIEYTPGVLLVKGFNKNSLVASCQLKTAGQVAVIKASADKTQFSAKRKELTHIEIQLADNAGNPVYEANNELLLTIEGPAVLLGLESGDLSSHEDYKENKRKVYNGKLLAYVQSGGQPGRVKITISSPGLKSSTIFLKTGQ